MHGSNAMFKYGGLKVVGAAVLVGGKRRTAPLWQRPSFPQDEVGLDGHQVERIADAVTGQVDSVDAFGELPSQTHPHGSCIVARYGYSRIAPQTAERIWLLSLSHGHAWKDHAALLHGAAGKTAVSLLRECGGYTARPRCMVATRWLSGVVYPAAKPGRSGDDLRLTDLPEELANTRYRVIQGLNCSSR
jgi:hypothetical protein